MSGENETARPLGSAATKIYFYDDKPDTVSKFEEILREEGIETEYLDDTITLQELFRNMFDVPGGSEAKEKIPAIDVKFEHKFRFRVHGKEYRIREPQRAGFEIIENIITDFEPLRRRRYILMSSAEVEGEDIGRLKALQDRTTVQFISKNDPEEVILEKTYQLLADPEKLSIFGYVKMFETFCDLIEIDVSDRPVVLGEERLQDETIPYQKYVRTYIERSREAKERISDFMAIELILRKLYSVDKINRALSELKSHRGESLKQMLMSGDRLKQYYVRNFLEQIVGGGV